MYNRVVVGWTSAPCRRSSRSRWRWAPPQGPAEIAGIDNGDQLSLDSFHGCAWWRSWPVSRPWPPGRFQQGLNHFFQTAKTGPSIEVAQKETFAPAALDVISRWILSLQ